MQTMTHIAESHGKLAACADNGRIEAQIGYKKTELGVIPEDWEICIFANISRLCRDRISFALGESSEYCLELENIEQGTGKINGYSTASHMSSLKSRFQPGNVLFGKLRAYLRKYWLADRDGVCSTEIWVLITNPLKTIPEYLSQLVSTSSFTDAASTAYGTHMPRSDWNIVKKLKVGEWEIEQFEGFDYLVVNEEGKLEQTIKNVKMIIEAERRKVRNS